MYRRGYAERGKKMQFSNLSRLRQKETIRDWISQTELDPKSIIAPYFVVEGNSKKEGIESMPDVYRFSVDNLIKDIKETKNIKAILLFGVPKTKDAMAKEAYKKNNIIEK